MFACANCQPGRPWLRPPHVRQPANVSRFWVPEAGDQQQPPQKQQQQPQQLPQPPQLPQVVKKHTRTMLLAKNTDRLFRTAEQASRCFAELNALQVEIVLYGERRSRIHSAQEQWEVRVSAAALESAIRSQRRFADGVFPAGNIWKGAATEVE